jgi:hypothetical protein
VGEHYEFHQVAGLNPTSFSYIVGQVTIDLARLLERALPGQILLGDFVTTMGGGTPAAPIRCGTLEFVASTAASLQQLHGLDLSGGAISGISCYLTGPRSPGGDFEVNRYHLRDKHSATRPVYNAKINIHRDGAEPIFLGIRHEDLWAFSAAKVETLGPNGAVTVRQRTDAMGAVPYRG